MFSRKSVKKVASSGEIDELLTRGVQAIYPSKEFLQAKLQGDKPVSIYLGIDPTGPTLHLGHVVNLLKLAELQKLGHSIILLIGDFTGMIGDPTDKTAVRKQLTRKEVLANSRLYKKQASRLLSFTGPNKAVLKYNSRWLASLDLAGLINVLSHLTVDQMLKRDMFVRRMDEGKPIYIHEFLYPMMQGFDSVAMNVDGEIGGNDQTFNMLTGRTLMKDFLNKEKFVITMKLLTDTNGKKMGKTEGNMISFTDSPSDVFGKVMSWSDEMIIPAFELCTTIPREHIETIRENIASGANPRDAKLELAFEMTSLFHGKDSAEKTKQDFINTFKKGGIPEDVPEYQTKAGTLLSDLLLTEKVIPSKTEWRRLVESGAVSNAVTSEKITDQFIKIESNAIYKIGKHRFVKTNVV